MTVVRVPLIVFLSLIMDLIVPVAMGSTEALDISEEEAIHRPRCRAAIRLPRAVSPPRTEEQLQIPSAHHHWGARPPLRFFMTRPSTEKIPQPDTDRPSQSPEDH
jgi:hypothetical protein